MPTPGVSVGAIYEANDVLVAVIAWHGPATLPSSVTLSGVGDLAYIGVATNGSATTPGAVTKPVSVAMYWIQVPAADIGTVVASWASVPAGFQQAMVLHLVRPAGGGTVTVGDFNTSAGADTTPTAGVTLGSAGGYVVAGAAATRSPANAPGAWDSPFTALARTGLTGSGDRGNLVLEAATASPLLPVPVSVTATDVLDAGGALGDIDFWSIIVATFKNSLSGPNGCGGSVVETGCCAGRTLPGILVMDIVNVSNCLCWEGSYPLYLRAGSDPPFWEGNYLICGRWTYIRVSCVGGAWQGILFAGGEPTAVPFSGGCSPVLDLEADVAIGPVVGTFQPLDCSPNPSGVINVAVTEE